MEIYSAHAVKSGAKSSEAQTQENELVISIRNILGSIDNEIADEVIELKIESIKSILNSKPKNSMLAEAFKKSQSYIYLIASDVPATKNKLDALKLKFKISKEIFSLIAKECGERNVPKIKQEIFRLFKIAVDQRDNPSVCILETLVGVIDAEHVSKAKELLLNSIEELTESYDFCIDHYYGKDSRCVPAKNLKIAYEGILEKLRTREKALAVNLHALFR